MALALTLSASCGLIGYDDQLAAVDAGDSDGPTADSSTIDAETNPACSTAFEPNNDIASATPIGVETLEAGYLSQAGHCGEDVDFYQVDFATDGFLDLTITVTDGTADTGLLEYLDSDGTTVLTQTGTLDTGSSGFTFGSGTGGKYFKVDAVDGSDWDYELMIDYTPSGS